MQAEELCAVGHYCLPLCMYVLGMRRLPDDADLVCGGERNRMEGQSISRSVLKIQQSLLCYVCAQCSTFMMGSDDHTLHNLAL